MRKLSYIGAVLWAALFGAEGRAEVPPRAMTAKIVILGEQHDNPAHHVLQAEWTAQLAPSALVFEMLTPEQAERANSGWTDQRSLNALLRWEEGGWPNFDMYFPIFAAAPDAMIFGAAVPRNTLAEVLGDGLANSPLARTYDQDRPLSDEKQEAREVLQDRAHCGALPAEVLPRMVEVQRLRDITLADAALRALQQTGGPVVVITGNGHARADWGVPFILEKAHPEATLFALGQGEAGEPPDGIFSQILDAPAPVRGDPCAAFGR